MNWHQRSPYSNAKDSVFPSLQADGRVPLSACSFVKDHLRIAAKAIGVAIADGRRSGLHNLRHSLSNWLVNKGKGRAEDRARNAPAFEYPEKTASLRAERIATKHGRRKGYF
jgi:hypothetical protein